MRHDNVIITRVLQVLKTMRPQNIFDKVSKRLGVPSEYLKLSRNTCSKQLGNAGTSYVYLLFTKRPISIPAISVSIVQIHTTATTTTTRNSTLLCF